MTTNQSNSNQTFTLPKEIDILELFSGIGGFTKGFEDAGYSIGNHYFSEIEHHAIANYKYNFPHAQFLGSVTTISAGTIPSPQVITFGSPCQDFSISGKRAGMDGQRSSLISEAIRIVADLRPAVFIWENVKGTFSSNDGSDFWAIIAAFAHIGGYRLEWQLLNTSWFLPQNRERIYLVGHATSRSTLTVFPFTENDSLPYQTPNPNIRRPQASIARTLTKGQLRADNNYVKVPTIAGALCGGGNSGGLHSQMTTIEEGSRKPEVVESTDSQSVKQINNSKESNGRQPYQQKRVHDTSGISPCLDSKAGFCGIHSATQKGYETVEEGDSIKVTSATLSDQAINEYQIVASRGRGDGWQQQLESRTDGNTNTLTAVTKDNYVLVGKASRTEEAKALRKESMKNGKDHTPFQGKKLDFVEQDTMNTITCAAQKDNLIQVKELDNKYRFHRNDDKKSGIQGLDVFKQDCEIMDIIDNHPKNIMVNEDTEQNPNQVTETSRIEGSTPRIRRLTEIECERLQGFPDDWTRYGIYSKKVMLNKKEKTFELFDEVREIPATARYKMCGNAVTVAVVAAIARKLGDFTSARPSDQSCEPELVEATPDLQPVINNNQPKTEQ